MQVRQDASAWGRSRADVRSIDAIACGTLPSAHIASTAAALGAQRSWPGIARIAGQSWLARLLEEATYCAPWGP
jgi:hypothetical protein